MPLANPKTNNPIPLTFGLEPAQYVVKCPDGTILTAHNGKDLGLLMNDPRITKFQPNQIQIKVEYRVEYKKEEAAT